MSMDVERIAEGVEYFHEVWASLLSIGLGLVLLYTQVRPVRYLCLMIGGAEADDFDDGGDGGGDGRGGSRRAGPRLCHSRLLLLHYLLHPFWVV